MTRRSPQASPHVRDAARVFLPPCEATADEIVRGIIEGLRDDTRKPVGEVRRS